VSRPAADFGRAFVRFPRPNPFLLGWRWRYEIGVVAVAAVLARGPGPLWTVLFGAALAAAGVTPYGRRRFWCVVTPHRVRTGCKHAWVHSRTGRIPMVLRTRPVPDGEQLLLLLRPGTSADDLIDAAPVLATACWARSVRVEPDKTRAHLVWLTVARYEVPA
jgi:hypothetical protein